LEGSGAEVWGLDVSEEAIRVARTRIRHAIVGDIECGELQALVGQKFDLILCGDVLEHLRFVEHSLQRIRNWLDDGGALLVSVPNAAHYFVIRELFIRRDWHYLDAGVFDRGHYRLFTRKSLVRLLVEQGFQVDCVSYLRPVSPKMRLVWWPLSAALTMFPFLNEYFVSAWLLRARLSPNRVA
jgi:trans-aconitate methyltransferase